MAERLVDDTIQCDLCREEFPRKEICRSDKLICLCPTCLRKIAATPIIFRESMERLMVGNVI